jgi:hypothetical protein
MLRLVSVFQIYVHELESEVLLIELVSKDPTVVVILNGTKDWQAG